MGAVWKFGGQSLACAQDGAKQADEAGSTGNEHRRCANIAFGWRQAAKRACQPRLAAAPRSQTRQRRVQWAQMAMATLSVRSSVLRRPRDHPGVRGDLRSDRRQPRHLHWPAPLAPARPRLHGTNIRRYPAPSSIDKVCSRTENIWFGRAWQQVLSFDIHFMQSLRTHDRKAS